MANRPESFRTTSRERANPKKLLLEESTVGWTAATSPKPSNRITSIADGTSNTILLGEDSGRTPLAPADVYQDPVTQRGAHPDLLRDTAPNPALQQARPPLYYLLALIGALAVAAALLWLIAF